MRNNFNVLLIGDVIGKSGRRMLIEKLPELKEDYNILFSIVNAENAAGGMGITTDITYHFFQAGIDVITSGNHIWDKKEIYPVLEKESRILRPLNYSPKVPGRGICYYEKEGITIAIVNLQGRTFLKTIECPFLTFEYELQKIKKRTDFIIVDFHAESTAEKKAFAYHFDGRVSAVLGTHTHVQTADEQVLPGGTGFITDVGMTAAYDSVIGFDIANCVYRFVTQLPVKLNVARGPAQLQAAVVNIDIETGKTNSIERVFLVRD